MPRQTCWPSKQLCMLLRRTRGGPPVAVHEGGLQLYNKAIMLIKTAGGGMDQTALGQKGKKWLFIWLYNMFCFYMVKPLKISLGWNVGSTVILMGSFSFSPRRQAVKQYSCVAIPAAWNRNMLSTGNEETGQDDPESRWWLWQFVLMLFFWMTNFFRFLKNGQYKSIWYRKGNLW